MYTIYKLVNKKTGKSYVGKTSNVDNRWAVHKRNAKSGHTAQLYKSMRKHGVESFCLSVIEENIEEEHVAFEKEKHHIKRLDTFKNGYNGTLGGIGGDTSGTEAYQKNFYDYIRNAPKERFATFGMRDKKHTEQAKNTMSNSQKKVWESYDLEERISRGRKVSGEKNGMYGKSPPNSIGIEFGGVVYSSLAEASRDTGISPYTLKKIGKILNG